LPVIVEKKRSVKLPETTRKPGRVTKAKILVVDDEPVVGQLLSHILEQEGYTVEVTEDGKDALDRIKKKGYSLILLDIKLPGLSGSELYERIRGISSSLASRVIFMTGDVMAADTEAFLARTKARFIAKPFNVKQLKHEISRRLVTLHRKSNAKSKRKINTYKLKDKG
jgi:CheY-like chemotaxis protein